MILRTLAKVRLNRTVCLLAAAMALPATAATTDNGLKMEVMAAPNLVVDSNVESPSSYSPSAAHLAVKITNTGATTLNNVYAKIGTLTDPATSAGTPGIFPSRTVTVSGSSGYSGTFSLKMPGGATDAVRYIPSIAAGQSVVQYFLVTYPLKDSAGNSVAGAAPVTSDDLSLNYDIWASAEGASTLRVNQTTTVTMRNEISAMANKIWPNTTGKVPTQYLAAIEAALGWRAGSSPRIPGAMLTEGIWYDLGNVGAGFDNNGDLVPDRNAWMQPVGDAALFDATALRLVKCYGIVIVKLNDGTEQLIPFEDRLYFENIPANNTGAVGLVYYEIMPLRSGATGTMTPYQEVASGYDNEKFNGDYGNGFSVGTPSPTSVTIGKSATATVAKNQDITYSINIANTSATVPYGNPELGMSALISDAIPAGTTYKAGSAGVTSGPSAQVWYSANGGSTWSTTEPIPATDVTHLRWVFAAALPPGTTAVVTFKATVPAGYLSNTVANTAGFGVMGVAPVVTAAATTEITGTLSISGLVYKDDGTGTGGISGDGVKNGTEGTPTATTIPNIGVTLYNDVNNNGVVDSGDTVRATTISDANGAFLFTTLPSGKYVVKVDRTDGDRPTGYALSTVDSLAVTLVATNLSGYEFGFAPTLSMTKTLAGNSPVAEGSYVSYNIAINDLLKSADWTATQKQTQDLWLTNASGTFASPANAAGAGTGTYATSSTSAQTLTGTDPIDPAAANETAPITHVEALIDLKTNPLFGSDTLSVQVVRNGVNLGSAYTLSANAINAYQNSTGMVSINVTSLATWTWADLKAANTGLTLTFTRNAGTLSIDRFGFRVTTVAADTNGSDLFWSDATTTLKVGHIDGSNIEVLMPSLTASPIEIAFDNANNLVYIGYGNGVIERRNSDGTGITTLLTDPAGAITGLEVDPIGGYFYWTTATAINRALISAPVKITLPTGAVSAVGGLAKSSDDYRLYWIQSNANKVLLKSSYFDGSNTVTLIDSTLGETGNSNAKDIEVDMTNRKIYFTNTTGNQAADNYIGIVNIDGSNGRILLRTATKGIDGLALDVSNNKVYWADEGGIKYTTLSGTGSTTLFPNLTTVSALEKPKFTSSSVGFYDSHKTLAVVPLVDTYDAAKLTYVSASIPPNSTSVVGSTGTLTWTNVGPINPDITKTITVTFRATPISGNVTATNVPNTATITNPLMSDGVAANNATSTANIDITATARIGDFVWQEKNSTVGYQSGTDLPLPGVKVDLYSGTTLLESTTTTAAGAYEFSSVANGTYIVKIDTTTLPGGFAYFYDADGSGSANQSTLTIASAADNLLQDFGYTFTAALIYGTVWGDDSGEGTRGPLEAGIPGVTVWLKKSDGTTITDVASVITAADGSYRFTDVPTVPVGTGYYVLVNPASLPTPTGTSWTQTADPDATKDSRTPSGSTLPVVAGGIYGSYDFGYTLKGSGSIGDQVFYDWDRDNIKDANDEGIPNVTVNLYNDANLNGLYDPGLDTLAATTETNASGDYLFSTLEPGRYVVTVDQADAQFPAAVVGSGTNPRAATLYNGTVLTNVDFGYYPAGAGSLTGTVWRDVNGNQLQAGGDETGLANITVTLQVDANGDGTFVPYTTTTTDSSGNYSFATLPYLSYRVVVSGSDPSLPSGYGATTATSIPRTLTSGSPTATANFGFNGQPGIGDFVFYDTNRNGTQDASEPGISGVTVQLWSDLNGDGIINGSDAVVATTTTSTGSSTPLGSYFFPDLNPGSYYTVKVITSLTQTADPDRDGEGPASKVPGLPAYDNMDTKILLGGSSYTGADFGYEPASAIGDFVWLDQDADGVHDVGEAGIAGVTVFLDSNGSGALNWTDAGTLNGVWDAGEGEQWTTTDNDGRYSFANLANGTYAVTLTGAPLTGKVATYDADGTGTPNKTSVTLLNGVITTPSGKGMMDIDFGLKLNGSYSISGTVATHDTRTLGICDDIDNFADDGTDLDVGGSDETELGGLTVYLYTSSGTYLGMTTTAANGTYSFVGLPTGDYKVVLDSSPAPLNVAKLNIPASLPAGVTSITPNPSVTGQASIISAVTISTANVTHVDYAFSSSVNYDFGDLPLSYEATTWATNGARHIIPSGGATVYLGGAPDGEANGQPTALANGDDLGGSDDESGVVAYNIGSWVEGTGGGTVRVTVPAGVTGYLVGWIDWNHNYSLIDFDNPSNISENIISRSITGTGSPQDVTFDIPPNTIGLTDESWLARFRIFTAAPAYPLFAYTGEATNGEVEDYLLTRTVNSAIGDRVWVDLDSDGTQDANEPGLAGVTVTLNQGATSTSLTTGDGTTDVDGDGVIDPVGFYRFKNLGAATYSVSISLPTGYSYGYDENAGTDGTTGVVLAADTQHLIADFGLVPQLADISGAVFYDANHDNLFGGDTAIAAVTVQLWTDPNGDGNPADGVQVREVYTNSSGAYTFTNVPSGRYVVVEIDPAGAVSDLDTDGGNPNRIALTLTGSTLTNNNFLDDGINLAAISGTVYDDGGFGVAGNGSMIDGSDVGVQQVLISLYRDLNGNGTAEPAELLATTRTGVAGAYSFGSLAPGAYLVAETDSALMDVTDADGTGNTADLIAVALTGTNITGRNFLDDGTPVYSIGGTVYDDTNHNFLFGGDTALPGVTVYLYADLNGNGAFDGGDVWVATQTTDGSGAYTFASLPAGNYLVVETDLTTPNRYSSVTDSGEPDTANDNNTIRVALTNANSTGKNFLDFRQHCPDTWAAWAAESGIDNTAYTGNPDGDRYDNLVEYAFCLPPNSGVGKPFCLYPGAVVGGQQQIDGKFSRTAGSTTDITYTLQYRSTLTGTWLSVNVATLNPTITILANGTEEVRIANLESLPGGSPLMNAGEGFVRMRVDLNDGVTPISGDHTAYAEVLGWTETTLNKTCNTFNNPYLRCSSFTGKVWSVSGQVVTFVGTGDLTVLNSGGPYYLEVTTPEGANEGKRFDLASDNPGTSDTKVTLANDGNIDDGLAPFNTNSGVLAANVAANDTVVIRHHWTLGEQFSATGFDANTDPQLSDQVQIYVNGAWTTHCVYNDPGKIWKVLGGAASGGTVLPPGQGMFVSKPQNNATVLMYGEVRQNAFIRPLQSGGTAALRNNLVGGGFPIDQSANAASPAPYLADREMNLTPTAVNGFFGSRDFKTADSFFIWKGDPPVSSGDGYDSYYLFSSVAPRPVALRWVKVGDVGLAVRDAEAVFLSDRSVFIRVKDAMPAYTMPCPWTP